MAQSTEPSIVYDKRELMNIVKVLRTMDDVAQNEVRRSVGEIAQKELSEIQRVAKSRGKVADRVAQGG